MEEQTTKKEEEMRTEFSTWLCMQIDKSKMTQEQLVAKTGYSETSVFRWVTGKHLPKLPHLIAMCEVFAKSQKRSPRQLVFEALMHVPEMVHAEYRWKRGLANG